MYIELDSTIIYFLIRCTFNKETNVFIVVGRFSHKRDRINKQIKIVIE